MEPNCIITAPVAEFCQISGLGRTKVYELLGEGTLAAIKIGKRRLIIIDSYRKLIGRQLETPRDRPAVPARRKSRPNRTPQRLRFEPCRASENARQLVPPSPWRLSKYSRQQYKI
jgi:excisionase family DNA binding protein